MLLVHGTRDQTSLFILPVLFILSHRIKFGGLTGQGHIQVLQLHYMLVRKTLQRSSLEIPCCLLKFEHTTVYYHYAHRNVDRLLYNTNYACWNVDRLLYNTNCAY